MKIIIRKGGVIRELGEGYADEAELQRFLCQSADLIPVSDIAEGARPLVCVGREIRRGKSADEGEGWLDLLYVDDSPQMTIVEAKLGKNRESHREVIGQILEYAAYASAWTRDDVESRAARFFASPECPDDYRDMSLQEVLAATYEDREDASFNYEDFIGNLENSLRGGRIRLIIAIDSPPATLLKIAEFVNLHSGHFDLYVFQLRHFPDQEGEQDVFVPSVYGRVARTESRRRSERREWTWSSIQDELDYPPNQVELAAQSTERLLSAVGDWQPLASIYTNGSTSGAIIWTTIECLGAHEMGVQLSKRNGIEYWFALSSDPIELPAGIRVRQTKNYLYLSPVSSIDDKLLRKYAEATMVALGIQTT